MVVAVQQGRIELLVESMVKENELTILTHPPRHEVTRMHVRMYKSLLVDHLDHQLRKDLTNFLHVYSFFLETLLLVDVRCVNVLHHKDSFCWQESEFRDTHMLNFTVDKESSHALHIPGLVPKIQLYLDVLVELLGQPLILEVRKEIFGPFQELIH